MVQFVKMALALLLCVGLYLLIGREKEPAQELYGYER